MKPHITIVIKPTLFCNTDCKHCYHTPEERVEGNISLDKVEKLIRMASQEYQTAWFIWHGGEPLTLPMSFYKEVIGLEEKYFGKDSMRYGNTIIYALSFNFILESSMQVFSKVYLPRPFPKMSGTQIKMI